MIILGLGFPFAIYIRAPNPWSIDLKKLIVKNMKREDQQDATIRCLLLTSVSTCFGHNDARNMLRQKLIINI